MIILVTVDNGFLYNDYLYIMYHEKLLVFRLKDLTSV